MTREEWDKLTEAEYLALSEEERLRHFIKFTEERYISYKKMLEDLFKDKTAYEPGSWQAEFKEWFKNDLREMKNREERDLKELHIEMEHCRHGLNPPWCYPDYKKKRVV